MYKKLRMIAIKNIFVFLFAYRLFNSFTLNTIFEPDEIWQNLEPIHYLMFGKGEMTWDWMTGIRSFNYVTLYYIPQYILFLILKNSYHKYCHYGYKIVNAITASLCDLYTIKIYKMLHQNVNQIIFVTLFSHALWLYSPRSHINSFEMLCVTLIFYLCTKSKRSKSNDTKKSCFTISMACTTIIAYLRPTSIFFLSFLYFEELKHIASNILYIIIPSLVLIGTDVFVYKEFLIPPLNFFRLNIYHDISSLFGTQPFYSHVLFLIILCGLLLPIAIRNVVLSICAKKPKGKIQEAKLNTFINRKVYISIAACCGLYFLFYSIQKHKEMRFLLPLVPFINILSAKSLNKTIKSIMVLQFLFCVYIGYTHQRYDHVIGYIRGESEKYPVDVLFCVCPYSLPGYSYLCKKDLVLHFPTQNPDVYSKCEPYIYKKFGSTFSTMEYTKFIAKGHETYEFSKHNMIVIYDYLYVKFRKYLRGFVIVKKYKYADIVCEKEKGKIMLVLKKFGVNN